jgi:acyl carrier protein
MTAGLGGTADPQIAMQVATMIETVSDGLVTVSDALAPGSLRARGLGSLEYLRLADALETQFGIEVELDELAALDSTAGIAALVVEHS